MNAGLPSLGGRHDHHPETGEAVLVPDVEQGFADEVQFWWQLLPVRRLLMQLLSVEQLNWPVNVA